MLNGCLCCSDCLRYLCQKCLLFYLWSHGTQAKQLNGLRLVCFPHLNSGIKILLAAPIRGVWLHVSDFCLTLVLLRHLLSSCITLVTFSYGTTLSFSDYDGSRCRIISRLDFSLVKLGPSFELEFLRLKKLRLEDVLCQLVCFRRDDREIVIANGRCWLLFEVAVLDLVSVLYHWRSFGLREAKDSKGDTRTLWVIRWFLSKRFLDGTKLAHLKLPLSCKALRWLEVFGEWMCEALRLSKESLLLWLLNFLVEWGNDLVVGVKGVEILGLRQYQLGLLD